MSRLKIYLASSWRNTYQPELVKELRSWGHEVYDFRNPVEGEKGFSWSDIDPNWKSWTPAQYKEALKHPIAQHGHKRDRDAMEWANTGILLLPSGCSAHLEAGWMAGQKKPVAIYAPEIREPELMLLSLAGSRGEMVQADMLCTTQNELREYLSQIM